MYHHIGHTAQKTFDPHQTTPPIGTHTDWLPPPIPPTGKQVLVSSVPLPDNATRFHVFEQNFIETTQICQKDLSALVILI